MNDAMAPWQLETTEPLYSELLPAEASWAGQGMLQGSLILVSFESLACDACQLDKSP